MNPLPQGNWLHDLSLSSASDGWAVGDFGTTLRFERDSWSVVRAPTEEPLFTVHAIDPSLAWAAGGAGVILRWEGNEWARVESGVTDPVDDLWAAGPDFAVAVVRHGDLIHWDGVRWAPFAAGSAALPARIDQVHGVSADDFWIRGSDGREPVLLHYLDGALERVMIPFHGTTTLYARTAEDAWLVHGLRIARWNGRRWSEAPAPLPARVDDGQFYHSVAAPSADEAYFVGVFQSLRFDGAGWHALGGRSVGYWPVVAATGSTVRILFSRWGHPRIFRVASDLLVYDNIDLFAERSGSNARSPVWGVRGDDVWVGTLRWNGAALEQRGEHESPAFHPFAIDGSGADDVFFVGGRGMAAHWNGSEVVPMDTGLTGLTASLLAVATLARGRAIAVGANGAIVELSTEHGATLHTSGTGVRLLGVWAAAPDDVFAVGERGTLLRYDGARWARVETGVTSHLNAVRGRSATEVYTVGWDGVVLQFDGTLWHRIPGAPTTAVFSAVAFDGYRWWFAGGHRAGHPGSLWTWDGRVLRERELQVSSSLHSLVALPDGEIWTAGGANAVLRRSPSR